MEYPIGLAYDILFVKSLKNVEGIKLRNVHVTNKVVFIEIMFV